jgi:predicted anti-sigma-YlaC factor YlaD
MSMSRILNWLWALHGLTCREAIRLLALSMDGRPTFLERVRLFVHVRLCGVCRNYACQIRLLQKWAGQMNDEKFWPSKPSLSLASASRIKKRLATASRLMPNTSDEARLRTRLLKSCLGC